MTSYTVLTAGAEVVAELERKKSRFLTVMRRAETADDAHQLVGELRKEHHTARHHCSAWVLGHDRRIQRANDDGEPSGTAGAPLLEALTKAGMPTGPRDFSDVVVVVVRWFGGTLLGAGGLVSAYSDSVVGVVGLARAQGVFRTRQRMRRFTLAAPVAVAGRWENELRTAEVTVLGIDYTFAPDSALLSLAVPDRTDDVARLTTYAATMSSGTASLTPDGVDWVDA
ncbi:IMPACT family protein [Nesterenkonia muleiensis]|uniref:IMPACT family protein n=1 Tax=Nesterenkonia muleiensis TaxID=2282648 RepID=UPI000E73E31D|nr:YigZ family protein [Nesterenkonia muleiensis]